MKISYARFSDTIRLMGKNGYSENSHVNDKAYDVELVEESGRYAHFLIRNKGAIEILAIVPFDRCNYCYPLEQEPLVELSEFSEFDQDELPEVNSLGPVFEPGIANALERNSNSPISTASPTSTIYNPLGVKPKGRKFNPNQANQANQGLGDGSGSIKTGNRGV